MLALSAITATVNTILMLSPPGLILTPVGIYGSIFPVYKTTNKPTGIISTLALIGFLGYILGPILNTYLSAGIDDVIAIALGGTALMFLYCSTYVLTTRKDMPPLGSALMTGVAVALIGMVADILLQLPALRLTTNVVFILVSFGAILFETSNTIHGSETNYIHATVSLYILLYNVFVSLLSILGFASHD